MIYKSDVISGRIGQTVDIRRSGMMISVWSENIISLNDWILKNAAYVKKRNIHKHNALIRRNDVTN